MSSFNIHTSLLFSPREKTFLRNVSLLVSPTTGLLLRIYTRPSSSLPDPLPTSDIDLTHLVVLPGLVDAHTHIFLHAYSETSAIDQMLHESTVERTLRAANHCLAALMAGYTTYRDLGTEGMGESDIGIRDAINRGIIPGPRLFVATNPIASSRGYTIPHENGNSLAIPKLSDEADGVDGVRAAVRRRLGAGADIIKFYADQEKRVQQIPEQNWPGALPVQFPPESDKPRHFMLFSAEEMKAIVDEAHESDCPVAAHASSPAAVIRAARAGVNTIEHGQEPSEEALKAMKEMGTIFVPTLTVMEEEVPEHAIGAMYEHTFNAFKAGIKLACGGDIGPVAHGENVRELELMIVAGIPVEEVLTAATLHGWEACGGLHCGRKFGSLEEGWAADLVGLGGNPKEEAGALRKVEFVMKDARVWKRDGKRVD
ncbi:hypothetical protein EG328_008809 [Venturia inaequalis]|uniref:Amidohydrolase-related domain-containing protein n=2 Tax=Venturia inaequalis TaxID=5025 RepID=A0A8H3UIQ8_VENIN|nr:hypothetical protein EG328_008809 [Venturia inaequalis]KAE9970273.1 hypothetical protein EG327_010321 [Venturia inaequalis]RDI86910.1 hypothetical protein Vi05172_g3123 [Venturia inaequalis]